MARVYVGWTHFWEDKFYLEGLYSVFYADLYNNNLHIIEWQWKSNIICFNNFFAQMSDDFVLFYYLNDWIRKERQRPTLYRFLKLNTTSVTALTPSQSTNGIPCGVHICLRLFWRFLSHSQRKYKTTGSTLVPTWYRLLVLVNGVLQPFCISWGGKDNGGCLWVKWHCLTASF